MLELKNKYMPGRWPTPKSITILLAIWSGFSQQCVYAMQLEYFTTYKVSGQESPAKIKAIIEEVKDKLSGALKRPRDTSKKFNHLTAADPKGGDPYSYRNPYPDDMWDRQHQTSFYSAVMIAITFNWNSETDWGSDDDLPEDSGSSVAPAQTLVSATTPRASLPTSDQFEATAVTTNNDAMTENYTNSVDLRRCNEFFPHQLDSITDRIVSERMNEVFNLLRSGNNGSLRLVFNIHTDSEDDADSTNNTNSSPYVFYHDTFGSYGYDSTIDSSPTPELPLSPEHAGTLSLPAINVFFNKFSEHVSLTGKQ